MGIFLPPINGIQQLPLNVTASAASDVSRKTEKFHFLSESQWCKL